VIVRQRLQICVGELRNPGLGHGPKCRAGV
jgi:hypothetical protein